MKETDAGTEELPDRPVSSHRNFVTENGLAAIEACVGRFEAAHRAAIDKGDAQAAAAALREVGRSVARSSSTVSQPIVTPSDNATYLSIAPDGTEHSLTPAKSGSIPDAC